MEFFIIDRNGQQAGPFSFDQLVQKGISPETLVWKQGMADWTPAWKVEELKAVLEAAEANQSNQNIQKARRSSARFPARSKPAAGLSESSAGSLSAGIPAGSSDAFEFPAAA